MSMLAVIMVALLNIGFTSCSNDDSDIPSIDGDPEGTVTVNTWNVAMMIATFQV